MTDAVAFINCSQLRTSHDTVVAFLLTAGCVITRVRVRLSDASGVAVEEKSWFNDSTDAAALAEEVAHYIASSASIRPGSKRPSPFGLSDRTIPHAGRFLTRRAYLFNLAKLVEASSALIP